MHQHNHQEQLLPQKNDIQEHRQVYQYVISTIRGITNSSSSISKKKEKKTKAYIAEDHTAPATTTTTTTNHNLLICLYWS
mmetsp:Transcript_31149/g.31667  ORF Transcript_31149/g.31667 Transcript_31149/m.31667 type:complete len:80 (-) Transcript_31149:823-1062(-)